MSDQRDAGGKAGHGETDLVSADLGWRLGRPDPALRQRTLSAVRATLGATSAPLPRWRAWRFEAALAAAIVACALLLPALGRFPAELRPASAAASLPATTSGAALETLDLNGMEPYIRYRLTLARRSPDPEPRYPNYDISSRTLDIY